MPGVPIVNAEDNGTNANLIVATSGVRCFGTPGAAPADDAPTGVLPCDAESIRRRREGHRRAPAGIEVLQGVEVGQRQGLMSKPSGSSSSVFSSHTIWSAGGICSSVDVVATGAWRRKTTPIQLPPQGQ